LDGRLSTVEANDALLLDPYLSVDTGTINSLAGPHVILTGANLHIRNGDAAAATDTVNGVGNLVVGYNEASGSPNRGGLAQPHRWASSQILELRRVPGGLQEYRKYPVRQRQRGLLEHGQRRLVQRQRGCLKYYGGNVRVDGLWQFFVY
jgi:hypothetical protein